jgi:DNA-binding NarL/FixJ family response regulator
LRGEIRVRCRPDLCELRDGCESRTEKHMSTSLIKVLLIGDYSIFRSALRMLIETHPDVRVIAETHDPTVAIDIALEQRPDLILVDLPDLGREDLFQLFQDIKIPVLVLVGQHDVDIYQKCLRTGISGLVLKGENADTLFTAISKVHGGEIWFDRTLMGETIRQLVTEKQMLRDYPKAHVTNELTDREKQVVELICKGQKNRSIAESLFITETTVRHHLTSVFAKLEISSRLELVIYAIKNGLVTIPTNEMLANGNGNGNSHGNGHSKVVTNGHLV